MQFVKAQLIAVVPLQEAASRIYQAVINFITRVSYE
jgi:hypothetical protein